MVRVMNNFKCILNVSTGFVIVDLVVALILMLCTKISIKLAMVIIGSYMVVRGLFALIKFFYDGLANSIYKINSYFGTLSVGLGLLSVFCSNKSFVVSGVIFATWLFLMAVHKLYYTYKLFKIEDESYPIFSFIVFLIIVMGVVVLVNPFSTFMILSRLIGLFILTYGILEGIYLSLAKKRSRVLLKIFE